MFTVSSSVRWLQRSGLAALLLTSTVFAGAPHAADTSLAQLAAGVSAEEGVRAVKRLQHSYAHFLDAGLWADAADLCTDDAVGEFPEGTVSGKAALQRHFMTVAGRKANGLDKGQLNVQLLLQPIVTLGADGATAKAAWHEQALLGRYGSSASWQGGIYENEYVLQRGVWKISRIHFHPQYAGGFDDYGHKAPARWNIPYHFQAAHVGISIPASAREPRAAQSGAVANSAGIAARIQRLEDETAVQNLQHAYGYYLDRKLWDDVADLFADDATLELGQRGVYAGRAHIRKAFESLFGAGPIVSGELFDHLQLSTVVTIDASGMHAAARTTQLGMVGRNGEFAQWQQGTYENEFVKQNGVWKLQAMHYFPRLVTDYDRGWAREALPADGPSAALPPDHKPTQRFVSFPALQTVGFHFRHPVTGKALRYPSGPVTKARVIASRPKSGSRGGGETSLASLQRRLDASIAVDAVENLMSSYGYYIDESAWDEMADTYASVGAKEITGAGVYVGPERIRKILKLRGPLGGRTANFYTIHQLTQPVIHVADDGLSAKARLRLYQAGGNADGSSGSWIGGIYENTAVFENGEWKFGVQDLHHIFNASYRNGWARVGPARGKPLANRAASPRDVQGGGITQGLGGARGGPSLATEFPPDRPIRARQYSFPEISEPAFHYRNPVTGRMPAELLP